MSILKKQGVAWIITIVMIAAAVGIGQAKASPTTVGVEHSTVPIYSAAPIDNSLGYIYDDAGVLSDSTVEELICRNEDLLYDLDVVIAVVTCNYGRSDLGSYAINYADDIGLGGNDMIVVLDISGDNYWLVQGANLVSDFTDDDCTDYAWAYMETYFARGDYDSAVLSLTEALSDWYYDHY